MQIEDYFYDTEFFENGAREPIDLISIGVKRHRDGETYYAVNADCDIQTAWHHPGPNRDFWLRENVLKQLPLTKRDTGEIWLDTDLTPVLDPLHPAVKTRYQIRKDLEQFFELKSRDIKRRLWAWYGDYDHVVLSQIWGAMIRLPVGMPMFTHDLKQVVDMAGNPSMPEQAEGHHNALQDAEHLHRMFVYCTDLGLLNSLPRSVSKTKVTPRPIRDNPQA